MNGFYTTDGSNALGYYDGSDLPYYYALYKTFATSDRYFSSVLSQTFPNRFYLLAGTSFGHIRNDLPDANGFTQKTIFEELDAAGISWRIYYSQIPFAFEFKYVRDHAAGHVYPIQQYYTDAANGALPQVSYVDPIFLAQADVENDEHPPSNIQVGEQFVSQVVPFPWDASMKVIADYQAAIKAADDKAEPEFVSLEGYLVGRLAIAALEKMGREPTRNGLIKAIKDTGKFEIGGLAMTYGPTKNEGLDQVFLTVIQADGSFKAVDKLMM